MVKMLNADVTLCGEVEINQLPCQVVEFSTFRLIVLSSYTDTYNQRPCQLS